MRILTCRSFHNSFLHHVSTCHCAYSLCINPQSLYTYSDNLRIPQSKNLVAKTVDDVFTETYNNPQVVIRFIVSQMNRVPKLLSCNGFDGLLEEAFRAGNPHCTFLPDFQAT